MLGRDLDNQFGISGMGNNGRSNYEAGMIAVAAYIDQVLSVLQLQRGIALQRVLCSIQRLARLYRGYGRRCLSNANEQC